MTVKRVSTIVAKDTSLKVGQFKIPLCKDVNCPTIDYLDLELTGPDEGHLGAHHTDKIGSGLPTSQEREHGGNRPPQQRHGRVP